MVIGLDGADFSLIKPWVAEGKLPTIAKFMAEGTFGRLKSTPDALSPAAWTSFATGKNPGSHGIYNFMDLIPGTLQLRYYDATCRDGDAVWNTVNKNGKTTAVLNIPMTYPADPVNGVMLSGWTAPSVTSKGFSHPPELIETILQEHGDFPLFPTVKKHIVAGRPDLGIRDLHYDINIKESVSLKLQKKKDWDLFVTFFIHTDQVQHYYWHCMDEQHPEYSKDANEKYGSAIFDIYNKCDKIIENHMQGIDDDVTVILMSDHGNGPNHGAVQYLPCWLKDMGFAVHKDTKKDTSLLSPLLRLRIFFNKLLKWGYNLLNKRLPIKAKSFLNALMPGLRDKVESSWRFSAYDWSRTKVFFHYEPRINLKGREPYGIVNPGKEYEEVRDDLIAKLYQCRDVRTGQKVVEKVYKGEEVYHGKHVARAPDVLIQWKENTVLSGLITPRDDGSTVVTDKIYISDERSGNHQPYGIFLAYGKHINKGLEIENAEIIDLAPTILHLMGMKVPEDMDGKVLTEIFSDSFMAGHPVTYAKNDNNGDSGDLQGILSNKEEGMLEDHLKNLGYME